ncbi:MAG: hypothetical protein WBA41_24045 [Rivularia sp. (in: cyanobacteria)]
MHFFVLVEAFTTCLRKCDRATVRISSSAMVLLRAINFYGSSVLAMLI